MKVNKRGNSYEYYFRYDGARYRKGGFKTKTEAKKAMADKMNTLAGGFNIDEKTPFIEYFEEWIRINKTDELDKRSVSTYNNAKNIFKEKFGFLPIGKITQMKYRELLKEYGEGKYLKEREDGRTTESVKKLHMCLKACLNDAVNEGIIMKSPAYGAKPRGKKDSKPEEEKYIQRDQFIKLKNQMMRSKELSYLFIYLLCITGGRFGEIQNLRYEHFNFLKGEVFLPGTKTDTSPRTIPLLPKEIKYIKERFDNTPRNINGYIFDTGNNLISHNAVSKVFKNFCLKNKLGNHTLHALRHTHASILLSEDISITYISKRLGHKDITITLQTYSHLLKDKDEKEKELMIERMSEI